MLQIHFNPPASNFIRKCERQILIRIQKRLDLLKQNPFPKDSKRIENQEEKIFRIRIGDYRILYSVSFKENLIFIENIDKRSNVYKVKEETEKYSKQNLK